MKAGKPRDSRRGGHQWRKGMTNFRGSALGIAFAVTAAIVAAHGHEERGKAAFGEPGDPKKPARVVRVVMQEAHGQMLFVPDRVQVKRGEQIRFALENEGDFNHEFVLGTPQGIAAHAVEMKKNPDMEHADEHSLTLGPYATGDLVWKFTKKGQFVFACLIPGHLERGMKGIVIVK